MSGRWWTMTFLTYVVDTLGFQQSDFHLCFFVRPEADGPPTILTTVVDNVPLAVKLATSLRSAPPSTTASS